MIMVGSQCLMRTVVKVLLSQCLMTMVKVSVRHIAEQVGDRLAIVGAAHCLSEHHADINASDLVTVFHCEILCKAGPEKIP